MWPSIWCWRSGTSSVTLLVLGILQQGFRGHAFTSPKIVSTGYATYSLHDAYKSYNAARNQCIGDGEQLASFTSNAEFQALLSALAADAELASEFFWVEVTLVGTTAYFGSETVTGSSWYDGEPDFTCTGSCCHRIKPGSIFYSNGLADITCSYSFNYICTAAATTAATATATTTTILTTATTTTTTTTPTTTTATTPTTATATTTSTTTTTTTTTPTTTTTTTPTTATITTTSTTTTTTTPTTTITTTTPTTATTPVMTTAIASETKGVIELTTGQQMAVLYLGIVGGGALLLSCVCTAFWVAVNRRRKHRRSSPQDQDAAEQSDDSATDNKEDDEDGEEEEENDDDDDDEDEGVGHEVDDDYNDYDEDRLLFESVGSVSV